MGSRAQIINGSPVGSPFYPTLKRHVHTYIRAVRACGGMDCPDEPGNDAVGGSGPPGHSRLFGQFEYLTRIDPVGIADLAGIGLVDRGVFDTFAIDAAGDGPEIVAPADDRLA